MLNYNLFPKNKKAQVSDALTWVVATIIIVFLLIATIYISSLLGKSKAVDKEKIKVSGDSEIWILEKSKMAYDIDHANKNKIELWIGGSLENGNS